MKSLKDGHIVADGQERIRSGEQYRLREREIRATVASRYQAELANTHFLRRGIVRLKMWRDVRLELQKLAPDEGLYFRT